MIEKGYFENYKEIFDLLLGTGGEAYVPKDKPTIQLMIELIKESGGISSLAHYGTYKTDFTLSDLNALDLDAIEMFHMDNRSISDDILAYAKENNLIVTGGSDFHGNENYKHANIGDVGLNRYYIERLLKVLGK